MLVYVAGPYRGNVDENIAAAREVAIKLWENGFTAVCPHLNTANFEIDCNVPDERYLTGDFEILARCDAIMMLPTWHKSQGARLEHRLAQKLNMEIVYWPEMPSKQKTEQLYPEQCFNFIQIVMGMYRLHLKKNHDYSPANVTGPGEAGILVRIWDKTVRLMNLNGFDVKQFTAVPKEDTIIVEAQNEPIEDSFIDLSVYGIIGLLYRKGVWGK